MLRTLTATLVLLLAMVALACSGDDNSETDPAAAARLVESSFQVMSPNFSEIRPRVRIPPKHTCMEDDSSPPLTWSGAPPGTVSLALIADDPENESGVWVHWVLYNIPPDVTGLPEGVPTTTNVLPDGTMQGVNDFKRTGYGGPCPPPNLVSVMVEADEGQKRPAAAPHKYYFKLYALDTQVGLGAGATKDDLLDAMDGHILAEAETVGKYLRPPQRTMGTGVSPIPFTATPAPAP